MAPKFGTSGLRGLVSELTPDVVSDHVRAFLGLGVSGRALYVGRDLRASSPALARIVIETAREEGFEAVDCGAVPTPALALAAMKAGAGAAMITGSHIPADRNGLKFYGAGGEITKADEAALAAGLGRPAGRGPQGALRRDEAVGRLWAERSVRAFGAGALAGLRIGVWSHSSVCRDVLREALERLGAEAMELGRSEAFVPVDTEAVSEEARRSIRAWVKAHALDGVISTDADGDRPLLADETGDIIPGDILGQITAALVGAETVATPISSNTGAEASGAFARVIRTKIGSPFVIAGMKEAGGGRTAGYEANGGFLLGFEALLKGGPLSALPTRDSLPPLLAPLSLAKAAGGLRALAALQPPRFTAADRLTEIASERSAAFIAELERDRSALEGFLGALGEAPARIDRTDGLRVGCASGRFVHIRPSGNAPELRLYIEAESKEAAGGLLNRGLGLLRGRLGEPAPVWGSLLNGKRS